MTNEIYISDFNELEQKTLIIEGDKHSIWAYLTDYENEIILESEEINQKLLGKIRDEMHILDNSDRVENNLNNITQESKDQMIMNSFPRPQIQLLMWLYNMSYLFYDYQVLKHHEFTYVKGEGAAIRDKNYDTRPSFFNIFYHETLKDKGGCWSAFKAYIREMMGYYDNRKRRKEM